MALETIEVLAEVQASLKQIKEGDVGYAIGFVRGKTASIVGLAVQSQSNHSGSGAINAFLPSPLAVLGSAGGQKAPDSLQLHITLSQDGTLNGTSSGATVPSKIVTSNPLHERFALVRCAIATTLEVPLGGDVAAACNALADQICSPNAAYIAQPSVASASIRPSVAAAQPIESLGGSWEAPVVLQAMAPRGGAQKAFAAPLAEVHPGQTTVRWRALRLDVLCYVPKGTAAGEAAKEHVVPALRRQLEVMSQQLAAGKALKPCTALHFLPPGFHHPITAVYPLGPAATEADESALLKMRRALHAALGLPLDRPLLRLANSVDPGALLSTAASTEPASSGAGGVTHRRLANVHEGLPPSGVKGGTMRLVSGDYDYFHYMQDKFDDSGWGCAYRSLQTICSWFQRQHYTARTPPGHREIQTTLVKLGDKTQDFIGSRQWIGAIELGYVLDSLLGVECKVITVPSGAEMPSKAREIAQHFETEGTPIMIGGGVLAYTLLGIDFNEATGEAAFLILDPHYTGADELGRIHSGQWVAWKRLGDKAAAGGDLFVANAFYNLLCPQRPRTV